MVIPNVIRATEFCMVVPNIFHVITAVFA